jgi:hypothetical protein
MDPEDGLGGDPPCWAHLFEGDEAECSDERAVSHPAECAGRRRDEFGPQASSTPA